MKKPIFEWQAVRQRAGCIVAGTLLILLVLAVAPARLTDSKKDLVTPTPKGLRKYVVVVANGRWRSVDGSIMVGGLKPGNGMFFQKQIMKRTDAEIEQNRSEAIAFFNERYGVDVLHDDGAFIFTDFQVDPGNHGRAYTVSGEAVPPEGWEMRMGGWGVFVVGESGITLGGDFKGLHLPQGSAMIFGDWNFKKISPLGEDLGEMIIHFRLDDPAIFDQFGSAALHFKAHSDEFGDGTVLVDQNITFLDDHFLLQQDAKNVMVFPANDK